MRFTKIKVNEKAVELTWTTRKGSGETVTSQLASPQRPLPALLTALAAFRGYVLGLLNLPAEWLEEMAITTLSISDEDEQGRRGLIVTATRKISQANGRPVVLNTPHMREKIDGDTGTKGYLEPDDLELLAAAELAATAYVKGEREQVEIFPAPGTEADAAEQAQAAAGAAGAGAKKKGGGKKGGKDSPAAPTGEMGIAANAPGTPATDDVLRQMLLAAGRDVPVDAIALWASSERDAAQRWAAALQASKSRPVDSALLVEPEVVQKYATLPLAEDYWTDPAPARPADPEQIKSAALSGE